LGHSSSLQLAPVTKFSDQFTSSNSTAPSSSKGINNSFDTFKLIELGPSSSRTQPAVAVESIGNTAYPRGLSTRLQTSNTSNPSTISTRTRSFLLQETRT
jgi:hypothetical protein